MSWYIKLLYYMNSQFWDDIMPILKSTGGFDLCVGTWGGHISMDWPLLMEASSIMYSQ